MPFTPFHMGPGTAIKALVGNYFSLTVFGFAQIAIDIEPLIKILRGDPSIHGITHTYLAAALIGIFSLLAGKPFCGVLLRAWNVIVSFRFLRWLRVSPELSWLAASSGALIGTFSHVFLDSLIHSDMHPFSPFSTANALLHIMPTGWVYLLCTGLGVIGLMIIFTVKLWDKWSIEI